MPRKLLKRYLPTPADLHGRRGLGVFGSRLRDPALWKLDRRSVSTAFAVGLFLAWLPVPGQMPLAALLAVLLRCNLPLSVMLVWISNPLTMAPMFFFAYRLGTRVLGDPQTVGHLEPSVMWLISRIEVIWLPMLLGGILCGLVSALLAWSVLELIWRWQLLRRWGRMRRRALRRRARTSETV